MDFFHTQNRKYPTKRNKQRLNQDQVSLLERSFISNNKLEPDRKLQLANQLGVPPRQVAIWYQNKRARWKTQNLELDYNELRQKLEKALVEKRQVEKEVEPLKGELEKAKEMVCALKQTVVDPQVSSNCNSFDHEAARSSSLHVADVNCSIENDGEFLPLNEDFYACFIGVNGSSWE